MADEEKIQIYHNAMCSKSREGMCMLEEVGDEVEIVEYTKNPLTEEQLSELIAKLGIRPKQLDQSDDQIPRIDGTPDCGERKQGSDWPSTNIDYRTYSIIILFFCFKNLIFFFLFFFLFFFFSPSV